jgi:hypothetical protein
VGFIAIMAGIWWQWEKGFRPYQLSRSQDAQPTIAPDHTG